LEFDFGDVAERVKKAGEEVGRDFLVLRFMTAVTSAADRGRMAT
jgi:hypothetical protein